jgi:hypothetical protein
MRRRSQAFGQKVAEIGYETITRLNAMIGEESRMKFRE